MDSYKFDNFTFLAAHRRDHQLGYDPTPILAPVDYLSPPRITFTDGLEELLVEVGTMLVGPEEPRRLANHLGAK